MATIRKKKKAPISVFQRDPGPWSRLMINWLATLAVIMVFGLVMLFSASYTTGYLRMGDSFHYIKQQALCMMIGLGCMVVISYVDHRFLRMLVWPGYFVVLAMLGVTLLMDPLNGCRRWIRLGGLTIQSSEVAKFEMILLCSHLAAKAPQVENLRPGRLTRLRFREWLQVRVWRQLVIPVLPLLPVVALLVLEPHMSGIVLTVAVVGIGIMAQIAWQVFCNIAVVTNTLPNTGISLPFFSSGGTSLILLLAEMGVMINIGRNGQRAAQQREALRAQHEAAKAQQEAALKEKTIVLADALAQRDRQPEQ